MPARERAFEAVLNEIVGTLSVTAQQRVGVSAQSRDVRFQEFGGVPQCAPRRRRAAIHRTTSNLELARGIASVLKKRKINGPRSKHTAFHPQMNLKLISNLNVTFLATADGISRLLRQVSGVRRLCQAMRVTYL